MSMDVDNDAVIIDLTGIKDSSLVQQIELIVTENENQKKMLHDFSSQLARAHAEIQELRAKISNNIDVRNFADDVLPHKRLKAASAVVNSPNVAPPQLPPVGNASKKQKKIFQVIETDVKTVKKQLQDIKCGDFVIKQTSVKAPIKIAIGSHDDVPKIRDAFRKSNISCHEFKLEAEKSKCFLIRGLTGVTDADLPLIKDELVKNGLPIDITISLFISGYMRANPNAAANSLIKLILPPNCDTKVLQKIKDIDHVIVRIEEFKNKSIIQCKNCQRFGHSASGCQHIHRYVKCGKNHFKDQCPRTTDKSVKLLCCNCGGEHSANDIKECSYAQKFTSSGRPKNNNNRSSKSNTIARSFGNSNNHQSSNNSSRTNNGMQPKSNNSNINTYFPALNYKQHSSGFSLRTAQSSQKQLYKFNSASNVSSTYAGVLAGNGSTEGCTYSDNTVIMQKLDYLINIVLKHEQILSKLPVNG